MGRVPIIGLLILQYWLGSQVHCRLPKVLKSMKINTSSIRLVARGLGPRASRSQLTSGVHGVVCNGFRFDLTSASNSLLRHLGCHFSFTSATLVRFLSCITALISRVEYRGLDGVCTSVYYFTSHLKYRKVSAFAAFEFYFRRRNCRLVV